MNFLRTDVICMRNVLKYHSAKDPGKVDSPFEVRFDMNASRKRKNTKPKGFFEKLKEQRNQRKADRAKQTREFDTLKSKKVPQSLEIGLFFCQIFIFII